MFFRIKALLHLWVDFALKDISLCQRDDLKFGTTIVCI